MIFSFLLAVAISIVLILAVAVLALCSRFSLTIERISDEDAEGATPNFSPVEEFFVKRERNRLMNQVDELTKERDELKKDRDLLAARLDDAELACKTRETSAGLASMIRVRDQS